MSVKDNPHDAPDKVQARKDQEDPWVMYLIVRESLLSLMSVGKVAAQVGHAVGMIDVKFRKIYYNIIKWGEEGHSPDQLIAYHKFTSWEDASFRKIVLKADDKEWEKLKAEEECFLVRDAGLTDIPSGSETVIGLWPMKKSQASKLVKRLQILK